MGILIIDSDASKRGMLVRMLEEESHQVFEAGNGEEGTKICREEHIDLVVTDILMPEEDGLASIRAFRSEFPDIKLIVLSAVKGRALFQVWDLGAECVLMKPFQFKELQVAVNQLLSVCA